MKQGYVTSSALFNVYIADIDRDLEMRKVGKI